MSMNELFTTTTTTTVGGRALSGTAQLTAIATEIANEVLKAANESLDVYKPLVIQSQRDNNAMDKLIMSLYDVDSVDTSFLQDVNDKVLDGMLKSQQSKRSRSKGKQMTVDNYRAMMVGAIAEHILRNVLDKPKSAGVGRRRAGTVSFSDEELAALAANQELLRKELRNVQSKKSIAKSKSDFDEQSEAWQALLKAEEQLKAIRVTSERATTIVVDTTKNELSGLLEEVDLEHLKSADMKALLADIKGMIGK